MKTALEKNSLKPDDIVTIKTTHGAHNKELYQIVGIWPPHALCEEEVAIVSHLVISPIGKFLEHIPDYLNNSEIYQHEKEILHRAIHEAVYEMYKKNDDDNYLETITRVSRMLGEEYMIPTKELERKEETK